MQKLITASRALILFTIFLGLVYPLFIMIIGQTLFPYQANGSLLKLHNKVIGSELIAQEFTSHKYFHSRFSAVNYNAMDSGGSNLAISNNELYKQIEKYIDHTKRENNLPPETKLPADSVMTSASGLDPHISLANAMLQLPRVAKHRRLPKEIIIKLLNNCLDPDFIGIWGQKGINVLKLNLELDKLQPHAKDLEK